MKLKSFLIVANIILCGWLSVSGQVFQNDDLSITKLEDNMWVIETTDNTTMYVIEGDEKSMLIDTGTRCKNLDDVIRKITQKPLIVVITHAHYDHAGNIGFFDEIWMHPADTVLLQKDYMGKVLFMTDGYEFNLGTTIIEVVHTPGHTPGSVVLLDWQKGNCYSGDAFGSGSVWMQLRPTAPMRTYIESCKKMERIMDKGISKIYCGHYPYVKNTFDKNYIIAMRQLAEKIDNGTAKGVAPYPIIIPELGTETPMVATEGEVSIVFDPEKIK